MKINFLSIKDRLVKHYIFIMLILTHSSIISQTLPYQIENNSNLPDDQLYIAIVGITDGHVWVDPVTGHVNQMSVSDNTVPGPVIDGNMGPGNSGLYANCFRKLSDIPNKTINIAKIAGCRILISFGSQLYLYFFGHSGSPSGYAAPNLSNPTDPNQGIKYELIELTFNDFGLWCNTSRVDSYQYPIGLEVWGDSFYKRVGELKTHEQILSEWQSTAPSEFQSLLDSSEGIIHFPTKTTTFPISFFQSYIDAIWNKFRSDVLVFNSGQAGIWRGSVSGNEFIFTRDGDGQVARIPGKPTTIEAMEGSGVLASGAQWDLVVQAQFVAAITRHAIDLNSLSGSLQDFGDTSRYYQTWPYNWYSKFFHRPDISEDSQTYTFAYDDVFDQSATVHTPNPNSIKITIGGFSGTTLPDNRMVRLFQHCDYGGYSASLSIGSYTLDQLQALGVSDNDISSVQVKEGYQIRLYEHPDFTGTTLTKTSDDNCLVNDGFNDKVSAVVVSEVTSSWSTLIEAENTLTQSGTQTESCSEGGLNVGWIDANDWLVWDVNIPDNGSSYLIEYRVATPNTGGVLQLEKAGGVPAYGTLGIPNTGGWQNWTTVQHTVNLNAGAQQIAIKALTGGWNINWLKITTIDSSINIQTGKIVRNTDENLLNEIILFPNPTSDFLKIKNPKASGPYIIFDSKGQVVLKGDFNDNAINISALNKGVYFYKDLKTGKTKRFIKN